LFDASGTFIDGNDDGGDGAIAATQCAVPASALTGAEFDVCFQRVLDPGNYIVAIQQFDNSVVATLQGGNVVFGNLSDGFIYTGQPNFTAKFGCSNGQFCDVSQLITDELGNPTGGTSFNRTGAWAFDILSVDAATVVPLPASVWFLGTGIAGLVLRSRRRGARTA
jgi:hypothetical protein